MFSQHGKVFRNIEGKAFEDLGDKFPSLPPEIPTSLGAVWADFDGDGFIDLYVGGCEDEGSNYLHDVMYRNQGDGSFKQVWLSPDGPRPARGIVAADYDEDGDLDVYVSNYRLVANRLWQNDGQGNLKDVAHEALVAGDGDLGAWGHTIGSAWGDLDNDGHLDLFVGNFSHPPEYQDRPKFLKNLGPAKSFVFEDLSANAGLHWQESYASPTLGDFDNDGHLDLFFTTVYPGDTSVLYRNRGDWRFENVTAASGISTASTYQAAWADFDGDGYLDLVSGGKLYRNPGGTNSWLKVKLVGGQGIDHSAIGTQVRLQLGDQVLTRQVESATGQGNRDDATLHFGLGDWTQPVTLTVRWLDGKEQTIEAKPMTRLIVQRE
jgi:hypothetical protein